MRNVVRVLGPLLLFGVAWGWASSEAGFAVVVPKLVGLAKPGSLLADAKEAPAAAAHLLAALPWYGLVSRRRVAAASAAASAAAAAAAAAAC